MKNKAMLLAMMGSSILLRTDRRQVFCNFLDPSFFHFFVKSCNPCDLPEGRPLSSVEAALKDGGDRGSLLGGSVLENVRRHAICHMTYPCLVYRLMIQILARNKLLHHKQHLKHYKIDETLLV